MKDFILASSSSATTILVAIVVCFIIIAVAKKTIKIVATIVVLAIGLFVYSAWSNPAGIPGQLYDGIISTTVKLDSADKYAPGEIMLDKTFSFTDESEIERSVYLYMVNRAMASSGIYQRDFVDGSVAVTINNGIVHISAIAR